MGKKSDGETTTDVIFLGSKITVDGDPFQDIKSCLLLGKKFMTNLDHILKSRDITLLTNSEQSIFVFPTDLYACESWTVKNAEC